MCFRPYIHPSRLRFTWHDTVINQEVQTGTSSSTAAALQLYGSNRATRRQKAHLFGSCAELMRVLMQLL
jgi:hypothetical protein